MYAVIETGGKQYKIQEGTMLDVELLPADPGAAVTLDKVLVLADGDTRTFGTPVVKGAKVRATVMAHRKAKKVIVFKYKSKVHYRRKKGHRQQYTTIRIDKIEP
jgi:large subunit ribosomal protein L21